MDRQQQPNVAETPPYLQPQSELAQSQLAEMRAFHEKESAKMAEDLRIIRNGEMERLAATSKELEKNQRRQEDYDRTLDRREKQTSWFKKSEKKDNNDSAPKVSSRIGSTNQNVR